MTDELNAHIRDGLERLLLRRAAAAPQDAAAAIDLLPHPHPVVRTATPLRKFLPPTRAG